MADAYAIGSIQEANQIVDCHFLGALQVKGSAVVGLKRRENRRNDIADKYGRDSLFAAA
jgi:hypothetical protein